MIQTPTTPPEYESDGFDAIVRACDAAVGPATRYTSPVVRETLTAALGGLVSDNHRHLSQADAGMTRERIAIQRRALNWFEERLSD
jgi:hypothetical protein